MKFIFCLLFLFQMKDCKSETPASAKISAVLPVELKSAPEKLPDSFVINSVDLKAIGEKINDNEKIKELKGLLKNGLQREVERPYMWDIFVASNDSLLQFYPYKDFTINNIPFKSYYAKINYEDGQYQCILLVNENENTPYNSMVVYEDLKSEENYQRHCEVKGDKVQMVLKRQDTGKNLQFQVKNGAFLDYFDVPVIDKKWGKEKSGYEYQLKGKISNNLKNGYWIEKKYSIDYNKNIIEDGNYVNGLKDGEWNYSPEGPVDKIEVYKQGKVVKVIYP
ncbi:MULTISPECIES: hypothetical protein [Chryseobacterium]|uniref:MORN repeat protein n=1 Tax=Chryseobacterium geocarposphaerae TaxID=1416776 RepID=A0ABU1LGR9_9FLAO|nr:MULTISPECIES: hypothetical protein [Chryseobacterium]MDR6405925.1 hypothetical protein [Chryseobacterium geocarposphaerae]MDR6699630.1 hypothetical protein [Chryseobacterium ginsenosidimutans]